MSHLSSLKHRYADVAVLKTALTSLGLEFLEGSQAIKNDRYTGDLAMIQVDLLVKAASLGGSVGVDVGFRREEDGSYSAILDGYDLRVHWQRGDRNPYRDQNASFEEALCVEYAIASLRQQHGAAIQVQGVDRNDQGLKLRTTLKKMATVGMRI